MKIDVVSDLHLDISLTTPTMRGGDILIIAGDLAEARKYDREYVKRFFDTECRKYAHVLLVMGNHEHHHGVLPETVNVVRKNVSPNCIVLNNSTFNLDGVTFIGGTMWTDMNRNDPQTHMAVRNYMNDFNCIKTSPRGQCYGDTWMPDPDVMFSTRDAVIQHHMFMEFAKKEVVGHDKVVFVTHHAPSELSISPAYKSEYLTNGGYMSREENFILDNPQILTWVHGHVHTKLDYLLGNCRVVCNPMGYTSRSFSEATGYDPTLTIIL